MKYFKSMVLKAYMTNRAFWLAIGIFMSYHIIEKTEKGLISDLFPFFISNSPYSLEESKTIKPLGLVNFNLTVHSVALLQ